MLRRLARFALRLEDVCCSLSVFGPGWAALRALRLQGWLHRHSRGGEIAHFFVVARLANGCLI